MSANYGETFRANLETRAADSFDGRIKESKEFERPIRISRTHGNQDEKCARFCTRQIYAISVFVFFFLDSE